MSEDLFRGPTPPLRSMEDIRRADLGNWTNCMGCGSWLPYADSWCPCVDAEQRRMDAVAKAWEKEHPEGTKGSGFTCFEGVMPPRVLWKSISRLEL